MFVYSIKDLFFEGTKTFLFGDALIATHEHTFVCQLEIEMQSWNMLNVSFQCSFAVTALRINGLAYTLTK